jgi:hypothetical protein
MSGTVRLRRTRQSSQILDAIDNYILHLHVLPLRLPINKKDYQILFNTLTQHEKDQCKKGIPYNGTVLYSYDGK